MLTKADEGGGGVRQLLTIADEGGRGRLKKTKLADVICGQPLNYGCMQTRDDPHSSPMI